MARKPHTSSKKRSSEPKRPSHRSSEKHPSRTIAVATLAALAVGAFTVPMVRAGRQRGCVERIWQLGGYVQRVSDSGDRLHKPPSWYQALLGDDFMNPVVSVRLAETNVSDLDLSSLNRLGRLTHLDLTDTPITDDGLRHLSRHRHLRVLALTNTRISDAGLSSLSACTNLRFLDLEETDVTDIGLPALLDLPNLQWLDLSGTRITDAGVRSLAGCPDLETLVLDECNVSPEVIAELTAACPNLEIHDATHRRPFWRVDDPAP